MTSVNDWVWVKVRSQVSLHLNDQTSYRIRSQLWDKVSDRVWSKAGSGYGPGYWTTWDHDMGKKPEVLPG